MEHTTFLEQLQKAKQRFLEWSLAKDSEKNESPENLTQKENVKHALWEFIRANAKAKKVD